MRKSTKLLSTKWLLPITLLSLTMVASACGNKPTETTGGTTTPASNVKATAPASSLSRHLQQLPSNGAKRRI